MSVIGIRRKRNAEPLSALLVSFKRSCHQLPSDSTAERKIFRFGGHVADGGDVSAIVTAKLESPPDVVEMAELKADELTLKDVQIFHFRDDEEMQTKTVYANPLDIMVDAVGEIGEKARAKATAKQSEITCNGTRLIKLSTESESDEYVLDLFYPPDEQSLPRGYFANLTNVRGFVDEVELMNEYESKTDDEQPDEDDSDSNAEDNWRNDYPEEDSGGDESAAEESDLEDLARQVERFGCDEDSFDDVDD